MTDVRLIHTPPASVSLTPTQDTLGGGVEIYSIHSEYRVFHANYTGPNGPVGNLDEEDGMWVEQGLDVAQYIAANADVTVHMSTTVAFSGSRASDSLSVGCSVSHASRLIHRSAPDLAKSYSEATGHVEDMVTTQAVSSFPFGAQVVQGWTPPLFQYNDDTSFGVRRPSIYLWGFDSDIEPILVVADTTITVAAWTTDGCYRQNATPPT